MNNILIRKCMHRLFAVCPSRLVLALGLLHCLELGRLFGADAGVELQLAKILTSESSLQEKDAACSKLRQIATPRSIPALALLLTDPNLSHSARLVLEAMPGTEAGDSLMAAMGKTTGLIRIGIIDSLGKRKESKAVAALASLLSEPDTNTISSAAAALGQIGGHDAIIALRARLPGAAESVRDLLIGGLLRGANQLLESGEFAESAKAFQTVWETSRDNGVRVAAFRGLILSSGEAGLGRLISAIEGEDPVLQVAAVQFLQDIPGSAATGRAAALLPKMPPAVQVALIEALHQRGDPSVLSAIIEMARNPERAVRCAAWAALGELGDASVVPRLLDATIRAEEDEQSAARSALILLRRGDVCGALLAHLADSRKAAQAEVIRALSERSELKATPRLLELAAQGDESARLASYRALAMLGRGNEVAPLTKLLLNSTSAPVRDAAQQTLITVCQRAQTMPAPLDIEPILSGISSPGPAEGRAALLRVCSLFADPQTRATIRRYLKESNPVIRDAAVRALCNSRDAQFLADLRQLASETTEANYRALAIGGYVRLATEDDAAQSSNASRTPLFKDILQVAQRPEEKRLVMAGLSTVAEPEALALAALALDDSAIRGEAAQAVVRIATAVAGAAPEAAESAVNKILATVDDAGIRQSAETVLKAIEAMSGFITSWSVSGPYRQAGQDYAALFDVAFPPELPGAQSLSWKPVLAGSDAKRPWLMDLLKPLGGEQCVAYARTSVYAARDEDAVLELGTDDGVKAWLNGKQIYAKNVARPLVAGSDKAPLRLKAGWNVLLLKITQNNLGWEFCARLASPDGSRLRGLQFNAARSEPVPPH